MGSQQPRTIYGPLSGQSAVRDLAAKNVLFKQIADYDLDAEGLHRNSQHNMRVTDVIRGVNGGWRQRRGRLRRDSADRARPRQRGLRPAHQHAARVHGRSLDPSWCLPVFCWHGASSAAGRQPECVRRDRDSAA